MSRKKAPEIFYKFFGKAEARETENEFVRLFVEFVKETGAVVGMGSTKDEGCRQLIC